MCFLRKIWAIEIQLQIVESARATKAELPAHNRFEDESEQREWNNMILFEWDMKGFFENFLWELEFRLRWMWMETIMMSKLAIFHSNEYRE